MTNSNIKWAALQPLTGGAYCGTESAVGHPAEFIISYPGFDSVRRNKDGNIVDAGNEFHLLNYLNKKNRSVPYYQFNRQPFQNDNDLNPEILKDGKVVEHPSYDDLDLVVAVPVCAGLSGATSNATPERKAERNCNMIWLAKYTLNVIKPKVYIFENAPRFMSTAGEPVRKEIEQIAADTGYSIGYYKTDTKWHDNCQIRPRTFIFFFRCDGDRKGTPQLGFEHKNVSVEEFLNRIPSDATQQVSVPMSNICKAIIKYMPVMYGDNWRNKVASGSMLEDIIKNKHLDKWNDFIKNSNDASDSMKQQVNRYVEHIHDKTSRNLGFYMVSPTIAKRNGMPSAMFKTIPYVYHYKDDRLYTIREWLSAMGMPYDFEMQGDCIKNYAKIGQNVPARTMQFIANEAINVINNWETVSRSSKQNVVFFDNNKQTTDILKDL